MVIISYIDTQKTLPLSEDELEDIRIKALIDSNYEEEEDKQYKVEYGKAIAVIDLDKKLCFFETEDQVKMEFLKEDFMEEDLDNYLMFHLNIQDIIDHYEKNSPEKIIKKIAQEENNV